MPGSALFSAGLGDGSKWQTGTRQALVVMVGGLVMDAVSIGAVLAAITAGAGEGLGGQLWAGICALVRRHRPGPGTVAGGSAELAALQDTPGDQQRAVALAQILLARAAADTGFAQALGAWWEQARHIAPENVTNTISDGAQYRPVLQGRDFTGSGSVTCSIVVTSPGFNPLTVSTGHATGSINNPTICRSWLGRTLNSS
jgi:hypothetical protein